MNFLREKRNQIREQTAKLRAADGHGSDNHDKNHNEKNNGSITEGNSSNLAGEDDPATTTTSDSTTMISPPPSVGQGDVALPGESLDDSERTDDTFSIADILQSQFSNHLSGHQSSNSELAVLLAEDPELVQLNHQIRSLRGELKRMKQMGKKMTRRRRQDESAVQQRKNSKARELWFQQQRQTRNPLGGLGAYKTPLIKCSLPSHDITPATIVVEAKLLKAQHNGWMMDRQMAIVQQLQQGMIDYMYTVALPEIRQEHQLASMVGKSQLEKSAGRRDFMVDLNEKHLGLQRKIIAKYRLRELEQRNIHQHYNDDDDDADGQHAQEDDEDDIEIEALKAAAGEIPVMERVPELRDSAKARLEARRATQDRMKDRKRSKAEEFKKAVDNITAMEQETLARASEHILAISAHTFSIDGSNGSFSSDGFGLDDSGSDKSPPKKEETKRVLESLEILKQRLDASDDTSLEAKKSYKPNTGDANDSSYDMTVISSKGEENDDKDVVANPSKNEDEHGSPSRSSSADDGPSHSQSPKPSANSSSARLANTSLSKLRAIRADEKQILNASAQSMDSAGSTGVVSPRRRSAGGTSPLKSTRGRTTGLQTTTTTTTTTSSTTEASDDTATSAEEGADPSHNSASEAPASPETATTEETSEPDDESTKEKEEKEETEEKEEGRKSVERRSITTRVAGSRGSSATTGKGGRADLLERARSVRLQGGTPGTGGTGTAANTGTTTATSSSARARPNLQGRRATPTQDFEPSSRQMSTRRLTTRSSHGTSITATGAATAAAATNTISRTSGTSAGTSDADRNARAERLTSRRNITSSAGAVTTSRRSTGGAIKGTTAETRLSDERRSQLLKNGRRTANMTNSPRKTTSAGSRVAGDDDGGDVEISH